MDRPIVELETDDAATAALFHDEIDGEIFDEELGRMAQCLAIERVQQRMAGPVGGGAGALRRRPLAEIGGHAAEGALINASVLGARKRHAPMFELIDRGRGVAADIFDRILIAEPVRPLHGVVHVPFPIVRPHIAERGGDAALGRDGMRAGRKDLGDRGGAQSRFRAADDGAQARAAGADDDDIENMIDDRISFPVDAGRRAEAFSRHTFPPSPANAGSIQKRLSLSTAKIAATPKPIENSVLPIMAHSLARGA